MLDQIIIGLTVALIVAGVTGITAFAYKNHEGYTRIKTPIMVTNFILLCCIIAYQLGYIAGAVDGDYTKAYDWWHLLLLVGLFGGYLWLLDYIHLLRSENNDKD